MTVNENLEIGSYAPRAKAERARLLEFVYGIFPRLAERRKQLAGTISGGEQQMLAVGRGMMLKPRLLMLDEPSLGLAPVVTDATFQKIQDPRDGDGGAAGRTEREPRADKYKPRTSGYSQPDVVLGERGGRDRAVLPQPRLRRPPAPQYGGDAVQQTVREGPVPGQGGAGENQYRTEIICFKMTRRKKMEGKNERLFVLEQ